MMNETIFDDYALILMVADSGGSGLAGIWVFGWDFLVVFEEMEMGLDYWVFVVFGTQL